MKKTIFYNNKVDGANRMLSRAVCALIRSYYKIKLFGSYLAKQKDGYLQLLLDYHKFPYRHKLTRDLHGTLTSMLRGGPVSRLGKVNGFI